ncbi:DUF4889 domain-containing protein [Staphylococcus aureus]|nr:DUF4889 domain-containing protein [Staphylococcus aureus]
MKSIYNVILKKTFYKQEIVKHDDVPHGLMMKIHDMHMN